MVFGVEVTQSSKPSIELVAPKWQKDKEIYQLSQPRSFIDIIHILLVSQEINIANYFLLLCRMTLSSFIRVSFGFYRVIANPFSFLETRHFLRWWGGEKKSEH